MLTTQSPDAEFPTSAGGVMLRVPAGSFIMGSPPTEEGHQFCEQQREVTFAYDFYLGKTPVTQAQYEAVTGTNPTDHEKVADAPVDSIPWDLANDYCQKLTALDHAAGVLPHDWEYRLPTEAEWEYACRAGSSGPRHGPPQEVAWYYDNAGDRPHAVGQKMPNAWGFQDMLGNIWEWCQDWFRAGAAHSLRGGCYYNSARVCRAAHRWGCRSFRARYFGFRLLAARIGPFDLSPPLNDFLPQPQPPCIYDAMDANDFDLALQIITADPAAVDPVDDVPPVLQCCIYAGDNPEWIEWLLDHGADIEHREQDYGSTPLTTAILHRRKRIIRTLVQRGADTSNAMHVAQRGLNGDFEDDPSLNREGYREIVELLRELGISSRQ